MPREHDLETSVALVDPLVGTIFDKRFRVEERIAVGGFGAIYRATHVKSSHEIALKVLLPSLAQDLGVVARFRREGDTLTTLRNPHTITAYELGQAADRTLFIVMELLHGESLFERYKANGPFEWKRVVKIAREVCESLDEAHALGIVHRDLKPTNIHLETKGDDPDYVKVLDFGIAKILGGGGFEAADLTNAGQMIGTIDYMSPEQMVGGTVTGQSDIYTLGIVMYEMIAGTTPFPESLTAAQALAAVMKTMPEALYLRAPVPEELDRIVMRCLERETHRRYQTVAELRRDLDRLCAGFAQTHAQLVATKQIEKYDDESTQFTPPPLMNDARQTDWSTGESTALVPPHAQLLAATRRTKRPSAEEATQFTPPPEKLLAESRRAKRATGEEDTQFTPPPQQLLADSRHQVRRSDYEETQFTPPPAKLLAESRGIDWDDDEQLATTKNRRSSPASAEDHERVTAIASIADIVERAAQTRGAASRDSDAELDGRPTPPVEVATKAFPRRHPSEPNATTATIPRRASSEPDIATAAIPRRHASDQELAALDPRPPGSNPARKPGTLPPPMPVPPRKPPSVPPPVPSRTLTPSNLAPPSVPRTFTPSGSAQTPVPQLVAAPFSAPRPAAPSMPAAMPAQLSMPPPPAPSFSSTPIPFPVPPPEPPRSTKSFDMGRIAAREAMIRRLIWVVALILAIGVGAILATQL